MEMTTSIARLIRADQTTAGASTNGSAIVFRPCRSSNVRLSPARAGIDAKQFGHGPHDSNHPAELWLAEARSAASSDWMHMNEDGRNPPGRKKARRK
jgi:hypothetical protein